MNRSLIAVVVVLLSVILFVSSVSAIQTGKLRVRDKSTPSDGVLDAGLPAEDAQAVNIVDETVVSEMEEADSAKKTVKRVATKSSPSASPVESTSADAPPAPRKATHVGSKKGGKTAVNTKRETGKSAKSTRTAAKTTSGVTPKTGEKKKKIYLRTDGLPEYAAKAKELLAAAEEQSWPGEPLVQGCTPLECTQWCAECGTTSTCENRCFLYSQCNDEC